ncbi:MAG: cytochrome c assembly protein [Bacteroidetes bacterium]|nr:MAG: cytochrome c assembly protein [Bacteroidota bacterium]
MEEIQYIGESLAPGIIGKLSLTLGFSATLLAALAYFFATQRRDTPEFNQWRLIGRAAFVLQGLAVFAIMGTILYAMLNKLYEYQYVWAHVSDDLPFKYTFSAFWEGQEGSFLLWMFWHVVLGMIILFRGKFWEPPVLAVLSLIQAFIFTMILGLYFGDVKIGSNPLLLLREIPEWMNIPLFNNADYVTLIKGNGLNPLLQNYWMTIHPPTLFLGFASASIPFCYSIAGLWTGRHTEWVRVVLPWALFSGAVLGTGILMGGVWAYEALTFGGYWAWDPVENMSLVPWIVLVAGIHANLVARNTTHSIKGTYLFYLLTFILVLYSTFLTRSGVLGESSVHAFTEMGLEWQLVSFIGFFFLMGALVWFFGQKTVPVPKKEEPLAAREFWMFIGALVLLFSAAMITVSTSLPVYNKIRDWFEPGFEGLTITDPIEHYNKYQLWIAVFVGLLSGATQMLRYRAANWEGYAARFFKHVGISAALAGLMAVLTAFWIKFSAWQYGLLLFSGCFAIVANLDYLFFFARKNREAVASVLSHTGFGILILGVMATGLNKQNISHNPVAQAGLLEGEMLEKNVMLFKGIPVFMSGYEVTYERDTTIGRERFFQVRYKKLDKNGHVEEEFVVTPSALYDNKGMKVAAYNPSTKHYLSKDIFTHIPTLPLREADLLEARKFEDTLSYQRFDFRPNEPIAIKDTLHTKAGDRYIETRATLVETTNHPRHPDYAPLPGDLAYGVKLALEKDDTTFFAEPVVVLRNELVYYYPVQINDLSMRVRLPEDALMQIFTPDERLDYQSFKLKQGETADWNGFKITFQSFNRNPSHPNYQAEEGDIAVGAHLLITDGAGNSWEADPMFLIRGRTPLNFKAQIPGPGLHLRFVAIDPTTESIELLVAQNLPPETIPVEISKRAFRTDYIILEAIIFPGIKLVWAGSILMMLGLGVGMYFRHRHNQNLRT